MILALNWIHRGFNCEVARPKVALDRFDVTPLRFTRFNTLKNSNRRARRSHSASSVSFCSARSDSAKPGLRNEPHFSLPSVPGVGRVKFDFGKTPVRYAWRDVPMV